MTLGESIYYYRKRSGMSQEALAERVGVSRQAVSRWELGDTTPEVGKLMALAEAFGITTDQLLSGKEPETSRLFDADDPPPRLAGGGVHCPPGFGGHPGGRGRPVCLRTNVPGGGRQLPKFWRLWRLGRFGGRQRGKCDRTAPGGPGAAHGTGRRRSLRFRAGDGSVRYGGGLYDHRHRYHGHWAFDRHRRHHTGGDIIPKGTKRSLKNPYSRLILLNLGVERSTIKEKAAFLRQKPIWRNTPERERRPWRQNGFCGRRWH